MYCPWIILRQYCMTMHQIASFRDDNNTQGKKDLINISKINGDIEIKSTKHLSTKNLQ